MPTWPRRPHPGDHPAGAIEYAVRAHLDGIGQAAIEKILPKVEAGYVARKATRMVRKDTQPRRNVGLRSRVARAAIDEAFNAALGLGVANSRMFDRQAIVAAKPPPR